ncbi:MAG TPA: serine/threonine protein phosphatase [Dokdonella sp.]
MAYRLAVGDRTVWLKYYSDETRRFSLGVLDVCVRGLGVTPLRPPPHRSGEDAKRFEMRRLEELRDADVRVPEVVGGAPRMLVLTDIGRSLSQALARSANDPAADELTEATVAAIADVHARGLCLGQPVPRNIVVDDGAIGFIDFEEDPREIMPLGAAQARDWLIFAYGAASHYRGRAETLGAAIARGLQRGDPIVAGLVHDAVDRLRPLETLLTPLGRRAGRLLGALSALRSATIALLVVVVALAIDYLQDGDFDLLTFPYS